MLKELKELLRFRELLWTLVERELRIRYKNSVLGFFWSLLNPILTMGSMYLVFKFFLGNHTPSFSAYVFAAYLPYMFFQLALMDSSQSVLAALPVVKKVYFPREILPLACVLSNFVHFLLALLTFIVFLLFVWIRHHSSPFQPTLILLPVLLIIHLALTTGLAFFISALNTFFEDVKYMVGVTLYVMFFFSPVMYFVEQVRYSEQIPAKYADIVYFVYNLNPISMMCTAFRKVMVAPVNPRIGPKELPYLPLDWGLLGICALMSFGILFGGYAFFNSVKWRFVERP